MSDRVILSVKYTPASAPAVLRKAVGGFLRYVQYRDKHPDSVPVGAPDSKVSGLLKYVAFRDRARDDGRLFGPAGPVGDVERHELANFVAKSVAATRPQRTEVSGQVVDRRRAVYRFVLSPETADGLDLRQLTVAAMGRLEREAKVTGLRWIAAEHRNTAHPHVHIVMAAMREAGHGYRSLLLTKPRLAAMKDELTLEIARQRAERRAPTREPGRLQGTPSRSASPGPLSRQPQERQRRQLARWYRYHRSQAWLHTLASLRRAARRYRARLEYEAELDRRQREYER